MEMHHSAKNASSKQTVKCTPINYTLNCLLYTEEQRNSIKFGLPQTTRSLRKLKVRNVSNGHKLNIVHDPAVEYTFQVTKLVELNIK